MNKIVLIGAGGHSKVIKDIIIATHDYELYAVLDDAIHHTSTEGGIIYANPSYLDSTDIKKYLFCIAIGNNLVRKEIFDRLSIPKEQYVTLVHPSAIVSNSANIGYGTVIMPNAVINADTEIGNHCIVNTNVVVEHDNKIGDFVHVSPSATLAGTVTVGEGAHIGSGAVIIPEKSIGKWSTIGAGAVVVNHIKEDITVVGVPAK